jgi:hypothetical protein
MICVKLASLYEQIHRERFCANHAVFTRAIMNFVLFFLDTFVWYIIYNMVFSIAESSALRLSIWTLWKDITEEDIPKTFGDWGYGVQLQTHGLFFGLSLLAVVYNLSRSSY